MRLRSSALKIEPKRHLRCAWQIAALSALGCLDEPPTFAPRGQIPPFIIAGQVYPPLGAIYEGPVPIPINVPFRSEDVNINLQARLYTDLVPGKPGSLPDQELDIPAGFYEEPRSVIMDWSGSLRNCHSLTLILTYAGNYDVSGLPRDDTRAARVVWWLNIDDEEDSVRMSDCPGAYQVDAVPSVR